MFDHVEIRVVDHVASQSFYETVLAPVGIALTHAGSDCAEWDDFAVYAADAEHPPTQRLHIGFAAPSRAHVDAFWEAGRAAGYRDDGAPGQRPYSPDYYGAFVLDPDGNSAEAVHRTGMRADGNVDHLWIRVEDVAAATDFYSVVAPYTGFRVEQEMSDYMVVRGPAGGVFRMLAGPPTENVHIAFGVGERATVDAFHAAVLAGGYEDNGGPGLRPQYSPNYYGAFVLDPAGHNIELVTRAERLRDELPSGSAR